MHKIDQGLDAVVCIATLRVRFPHITNFFCERGCSYWVFSVIIIIIISLLRSLLPGHRPSLWITYKENGL
jgi:hypothetical protein